MEARQIGSRDMLEMTLGKRTCFTLLISPGNVANFSVIRNVDLTLCLCLGTSEYTANFQLRLKPLQQEARWWLIMGNCLVFTVRGNSAISFANVAVNRTRLPVLGKKPTLIPAVVSKLSFYFPSW